MPVKCETNHILPTTDNIDYEDIKHFIKEHTTPGQGKAVAIPGSTDDNAKHVEDSLFSILRDQEERISWFVRSKVGEIKRRLEHLDHQIKRFAARKAKDATRAVSVKRLERYGHIETDIIKVGEEIKSLSRFVGVQQTAFRKLLKKYKKWTGSVELSQRFNKEILDSSSSFTKTDLQTFLAQYDELLAAVRTLYDEHLSSTRDTRSTELGQSRSDSQSQKALPFAHVQDILERGKQVEFDHLVATLPLGANGKSAAYWVHSDNLVELQVLLSQHTRSFTSYRKESSTGTPSSPMRGGSHLGPPNFFDVIADDQDRYLSEQSSQTLGQLEGHAASTLQTAAICVRTTKDDEAALVARRQSVAGKLKGFDRASVKRKYAQSLLERDPSFAVEKATVPSVAFVEEKVQSTCSLQVMKHWLSQHNDIQPIATIQSHRSRFHSVPNDATGVLLAALDNAVSVHFGIAVDTDIRESSSFPYAILQVRQEGAQSSDLIQVLDSSHLVERVRGFSMEHYAVWDVTRPSNVATPSWVSLLEQDIRKLPNSTERRVATHNGDFSSQSTTPQVLTTASSETGNTVASSQGPTTPYGLDGTAHPHDFSTVVRHPRKKSQRVITSKPMQQYWSEYDHPEDSDNENGYVIYINPDEESWFDQAWTKMGKMFRRSDPRSNPSLSSSTRDLEAGSHDGTEDSDDEEHDTNKPLIHRQLSNTYGAIVLPTSSRHRATEKSRHWPPRLPLVCVAASVIILSIAFILAATGRKKQASEVDAGIIFAVASSLAFAMTGVLTIFKHRARVSWQLWVVAIGAMCAVAVTSGVLLGWAIA